MGESLLEFYKTKVKNEYKLAFYSTFLLTLLIHLYKFTNTLPNHDSVFNYYSDQNVLGSGRWALSLACGISSYYDLPWVIGILSAIFIALTVVVIVAIFQVKNPVLIVLTGALLAASPATTQTFFFLYTADGYMIAMFLSSLAVYFSRIEEKRVIYKILSTICICVSCGIYQAYFSFALILALCYFIDILLQNKYSKRDCYKWILQQAIIYTIALITYYVIWKICMHLTGTTANDYLGISEVGSNINIGLFVHGIINAIQSTIFYFVQWDVFAHGFTLYSILNIIFLIIMAIGIIISCKKSGLFKIKWATILLTLCLIAIIPFACMWCFTSDSLFYRPMMLQCFTLLFFMTAFLYEMWFKSILKNFVCIFLIIVTLNHALMANICYFYMNSCYERTYAEGLEMMSQIHDIQDEFYFDKIAIVGSRYSDVGLDYIDTNSEKKLKAGEIYTISTLIEKTLIYDSEHTTRFLQATFGLEIESLDKSQRNELLDSPEVQTMECWPSDNSITVINDTLVIKLSDTKEKQ